MEWFDIDKYISDVYPLIIVIGGRGIGKTYSTLRHMVNKEKFPIYMRRTSVEMDASCDDYGNPFKTLNHDYHWNLFIECKKKMYFIRDNVGDDITPEIYTQGYGACLSTFSNLKGVDFSESTFTFYDEFIPPPEKKRIKNEADAFFNYYETVNRNRELKGEKPHQVVLSSNSVSLNSPILEELGLVTVIENMLRNGEEKRGMKSRGILIILPNLKEFREAKSRTFLYNATQGTNFHESSLDNKFAYDSFANIAKRNLKEYTPVMAYENIYIYRHKSRLEYYVSYSRADCERYTEKDTKILFIRRLFPIKDLLLNGTFIYENFSCKSRLMNVMFG